MSEAAPSSARSTHVRVRYAETDQMGVAYYANYFVWFEVARTEWLRQSGWSYREMELTGVSLPVIEAHCDFRKPARYDDTLEIRTRATVVTPVRLRFDYEICRETAAPATTGPQTTASMLAAGHTVHASLDVRGRPCRLPPRVHELLG